MNKNLIKTNVRLIKFSVIDLQGREIEVYRRFCSRPGRTKEYKSLLKKLNKGQIKAIQTGPVLN